MNFNNERSFFAGQAEVIARLSGLLVIILFFVIYALATTQIILDWTGVVKSLGFFWFLYEITSLIFYQLFQYFQRSGETTKTVKDSVRNSKSFEPLLNENQKLANDNDQSTNTTRGES
jgi:hypothetical protein